MGYKAPIRDYVWTLVVLLGVLYASAVTYRVTVPQEVVIAVRGRAVLLGCEFTPDPEVAPDFPSLVVTWQRTENSQVVHSFYYGRDQLDRQAATYQNRTTLFTSELVRGNASLLLWEVGLEDTGGYLCVVSTKGGTDRAELKLQYAAFYTEPRLSINVHSTNVTMRYEAEGFPEPDVRWVGEGGDDLQHHEEISSRELGLFHLMSSYIADGHSVNVTFILENQLLNQDLRRPVNFNFSYTGASCDEVSALTAVAVICPLLCIAVLVVWWYCKKK
ncbi:CD276 antigen isoform X2 [Brachyhypopomus gauderio]